MRSTILLISCASFLLAQAPRTREADELNWMEYKDLVPAKINTILFPTGTVEAHGVAHNGADSTVPTAIARRIAPGLNALVAPTLNYGITGSLEAFAGGIAISDEAYRAFTRDILRGFARHGIKNILIVNGHGGNTAALNAVAEEVGRNEKVRILIVNWWTYCSDLTFKIFGEDGGHAGWNETAMVQATTPQNIRKELYRDELATARGAAGTWTAYPFPSSIILYQPKQGYVKFDEVKAKEYFNSCSDKIAALGAEVIQKWDLAGLYVK
ncbi:creatininase family protein [Bryobacter aggregatus]|uniref:creatininase family protein n=1 Tax=Bryobacter aggregatus TaxID=360054 RepID=UPI0004E1B79F|nr:creatininase family protein [Bryobacter aggregatus]